MSPRTDLLPIGVIARPHGVRGMLRVRTYAADSDVLATARRIYLGPDEREFVVETAARERDGWLVRLRGIDDRDQADTLRGAELRVLQSELPALDDDEVYVRDLVGCTVVDPRGEVLGVVRSVQHAGAQELLVLERQLPSGATAEGLVPFVAPIVVSVDVAARRIVCDPPEGLFDLDVAR